ncbi:outer membrane beta-barrel protein [Pontibacter roseus]|uniref:outer membrane beta-barrel protein n=1 Tax=Pontibacter roseus TaxID=336989 RepID=UPI00036ED3DA|nr:outer membrane beta-barrel protein [Pontibacter roseus]
MKKLYLLMLGLCCGSIAYGQKVETSVFLNSGLSRFGGESADKTTSVSIYSSGTPTYYNNNPYGSRFALTYGGGLQVQLVASKGFLLGTQVSFEQLRSRVEIDVVHGQWTWSSSTSHAADGASQMKANFVNLQPYLGWRVMGNDKLDVDLTMGTDVGLNQKMAEKGKATIQDGTTFRADREYDKAGIDFRPRIGAAVYKGNLGASVSYAYGLTNYQGNLDGLNSKVYMRALRMGLHYRL